MSVKTTLSAIFMATLAASAAAVAPAEADVGTAVSQPSEDVGGRKLLYIRRNGEPCRTQKCIDRTLAMAKRNADYRTTSEDSEDPEPSPEPEEPAPTPPTPSPEPEADPTPPPPPPSGNCGMDEVEQYMFDETNRMRKGEGKPELACDSAGNAMALEWCKGQCSDGEISHDGFSGRCNELGWGNCGENVAYNKGYPGGAMGAAEQAMDGWWNSEGHKANILSDSKSHSSVGYYLCDDGRYYFTGLFGK